MSEYELHQIRSAELIREAQQYRQAREARRARREEHHAEDRIPRERPRRLRFPRPA